MYFHSSTLLIFIILTFIGTIFFMGFVNPHMADIIDKPFDSMESKHRLLGSILRNCFLGLGCFGMIVIPPIVFLELIPKLIPEEIKKVLSIVWQYLILALIIKAIFEHFFKKN